MNLATPGVFAFFDSGMSASETEQFARTVEKLGYSALWVPEGAGRETFSHASYLLAATQRLVLAAGIANVFMREPSTAIRAARTLAERFEERFILGLGVSAKAANTMRGLPWDKPYSYMREYLRKMKSTAYAAPSPRTDPSIVVAAILPKMLKLAASETQGTHTYFVPPEHTSRARAALGPNRSICPASRDARDRRGQGTTLQHTGLHGHVSASSTARARKNLLALGFEESDFGGEFSERLVDAVVAWGGENKLRERVEAHYKAGATHVCVLPLRSDGIFPSRRTRARSAGAVKVEVRRRLRGGVGIAFTAGSQSPSPLDSVPCSRPDCLPRRRRFELQTFV